MSRFNMDDILSFGGILGILFRRSKKVRRLNAALMRLADLDAAAEDARGVYDKLRKTIATGKTNMTLNREQIESLALIFNQIDDLAASLRRI